MVIEDFTSCAIDQCGILIDEHPGEDQTIPTQPNDIDKANNAVVVLEDSVIVKGLDMISFFPMERIIA